MGKHHTPVIFVVFSLAHLRNSVLVLRARRLNEEDELMKKRTSLVCFLIFTLCVFYISIPNTVFGQEEEASLTEQVIENHGETLMRPKIQGGFLLVLDVLEDNPTNQGPLECWYH